MIVVDEATEREPVELPLASYEYEERSLHGPARSGYLAQHVLEYDFDAHERSLPIQYAKVEQPVEARAMIHDNDRAGARIGVCVRLSVDFRLVQHYLNAAHVLQEELEIAL